MFCSYVALCTGVGLILVHSTLIPPRRVLSALDANEVREHALNLGAELHDVEIAAADDVVLRAWYIQPRHADGDAVILLHGLGDNRLGMIGYAEILLAHGYSVLMPDARAHGLSGGDIATYGVLERDDIKKWFEWLDGSAHPPCIFGLGESMGAAQLLQSVAVEQEFCAVVAESSFANFREIAYDRLGQRFHAGPWVGRTVLRPVIEIALAYVRWKYRVLLASASPEDAVAGTHVPVLLVHWSDGR